MLPARRVAVGAALVLVVGCEQEFVPPEVVVDFEGAHLRYAVGDGAVVCGGTREYLDRYLGALKKRFDTEDYPVFDYRHTLEDLTGLCVSDRANACAFKQSAQIWSNEAVLEHELVHAAIHRESLHPVLEEGVAGYFEDDWLVGRRRFDIGHVFDDVGVSSSSPAEYYDTAGHFASFLVNERGPLPNYLAFIRGTRRGDDRSVLDEAATSAYATDLDGLIDEHRRHVDLDGSCSGGEYRSAEILCDVLEDAPCSADAIEDGWDTYFEMELDLACDGAEAIGPRDLGNAGEVTWAGRKVDIRHAGEYRLHVFAAGDPDASVEGQGEVWVEACAGGCQHHQSLITFADDPIIVRLNLETGPHLVRVRHFADAPGPAVERFGVRLEPSNESENWCLRP